MDEVQMFGGDGVQMADGGSHLSLYETHWNGPANDAAGRTI